MGKPESVAGIQIEASDVSGQKVVNVGNVPRDATIGEVVQGLLGQMELPQNVPHQARLEREGRHLHSSELVSDALEAGDRLTLQPNINAGGPVG